MLRPSMPLLPMRRRFRRKPVRASSMNDNNEAWMKRS